MWTRTTANPSASRPAVTIFTDEHEWSHSSALSPEYGIEHSVRRSPPPPPPSVSDTVSNFITSSTNRPSPPNFFTVAAGAAGALPDASGTMPGELVTSSASYEWSKCPIFCAAILSSCAALDVEFPIAHQSRASGLTPPSADVQAADLTKLGKSQ